MLCLLWLMHAPVMSGLNGCLLGRCFRHDYAQHLLYSWGAKVGPAVKVLEECLCGLYMFQVHSMCSADRGQTAALQSKLSLLVLGEQPAL